MHFLFFTEKKNHNMEQVVNAFLINVNITLYTDQWIQLQTCPQSVL